MKLLDKIIGLRKSHGMSQEDIAEKLNVSRQTISRWESGTAMPDANNILQISKLFGVTTDYLLNDDYESDQDVPVVKSTKNEAGQKIIRVIALCVSAFGLFGNLVIYILSRFIEVMIPQIIYENDMVWYRWNTGWTGRSYKYFIQEYDLKFLVGLFWFLAIGGIIIAFVPKEKFQDLKIKLKKLAKKSKD